VQGRVELKPNSDKNPWLKALLSIKICSDLFPVVPGGEKMKKWCDALTSHNKRERGLYVGGASIIQSWYQ
jgi:hypothetical protein